ncbi:MAG: bifunctional hydroxymethylpyrimidine kinase/phosphomethylpyrimidine kinase [Opitutaceae bacterium]
MSARLRPTSSLPVALTIAGSDSGGGAGIQADLLTFAALGVFGTTAITCLTAQNPDGVSRVHEAPAEMVRKQMRQAGDFFAPRAAKTGMLFSRAIIREVAGFLGERKRRLKTVVDPVMVATSGARLLREDAIAAMLQELIPLATLVTPNLDEAAVMLGERPSNRGEAVDAADELARRFRVPFLLKGGHMAGAKVFDVLAVPKALPVALASRRIENVNTHGSGCTLSAAIAAHLARGATLEAAVAGGRAFLHKGLRRPLRVRGENYIAHR